MPYDKQANLRKCFEVLSTYYNPTINNKTKIIKFKLDVCRKMCGADKKDCDNFIRSMKHIKK